PTSFTVTFTESGLASGTSWSVTFNGVQENSTTSTITFTGISAGTYSYMVSSITGYRAVPSGTVTVTGNSSVQISFVAVPTSFTVTFTESGLASGTSWSVTFNGVQQNSTTSTITFTGISAGTYSYTIQNVSSYVSPGAATITINGNSNVNVAFAKSPSTPSGISSFLATGTGSILTVIIIIVLVIAIIGLIVAYVRKPKNPKVIQTPEEEKSKQENNP
ncbi:MAG: hypothetical protein ACP5T1_04390, partial [Thermoplasmata archaeon]